jgi:hypothetical protein
MRAVIALAADVCTVAGSVIYVRATLKNTAHPELVSWGAWALLLAESTSAEVDGHSIPAAVYTWICAVACAAVFGLGLRRGTWAVTRLDICSIAAVLAGLVLLEVVHNPGATVAVNVLADVAAYLPTMRHAWQEPSREPWRAYLLFAAGAGFTLAISEVSWTGLAYPLYLFIADLVVVAFIFIRSSGDDAHVMDADPECEDAGAR